MYQRALTGFEKELGPDYRDTLLPVDGLRPLTEKKGYCEENSQEKAPSAPNGAYALKVRAYNSAVSLYPFLLLSNNEKVSIHQSWL